MAISESITLLGAGVYKDIPNVLTLKAIPTGTELDYVGGEDFQKTMLDVIFPKAIEEKCDFHKLLEIDFHWICRCLRMLNYGPYYTANSIYCPTCGLLHGEYRVDLMNVEAKPLPQGFTNSILISKDEFLDFNEDITLKLLTIQDAMRAEKDTLFTDSKGGVNLRFARLCYTISSIGNNSKMSAMEIKFALQNKMSSADLYILEELARERTDFGLRAGGGTVCPTCHNREAAFPVLVDDRFFRPTLGDLRAWKTDRLAKVAGGPSNATGASGERKENIPTNAPAKV